MFVATIYSLFYEAKIKVPERISYTFQIKRVCGLLVTWGMKAPVEGVTGQNKIKKDLFPSKLIIVKDSRFARTSFGTS